MRAQIKIEKQASIKSSKLLNKSNISQRIKENQNLSLSYNTSNCASYTPTNEKKR